MPAEPNIAELQAEIARLKAEQEKLRQVCQLQQRERQLIGYELHDGLVQYLVGAKMLVESLDEAAAGDSSVSNTLKQVQAFLTKAVDEGRRLIGDLRPTWIEEHGIVVALGQLIAEQSTRGSTQIAFAHAVQFERLPPLLTASLYRIVQESLSNIVRHSQATQAEVVLQQQGDRLKLEIRDNGIGFDVAQARPNHFGLEGIRLRAELFGGNAQIDSQPGHGTTIRVELPIGHYQ